MTKPNRFSFIDDMRGLVVVMMGVGHSSYYFHSMWKSLDYTDPFFDNLAQFLIRYQGYLCAPGFLMLAGAMVWLSYFRGRSKGLTPGFLRAKFIKRGLFLLVVQAVWVNASWGGFRMLRLFHMGVIGCIGFSVMMLALLVSFRWQIRLAIGLGITALMPVLINIPYDPEITWRWALAQTFIDAGSFNVYPVVPWFALAVLGSVMAEGWFVRWEGSARTRNTLFWGLFALAAGAVIRLIGGYGNTFAFDGFGTFSYFLDQKYPPNIVHHFWVFGGVCLWIAFFMATGSKLKVLLHPLKVYGSVPLFYYMVHIPLLAIFAKRLGFFYREGETVAVFVGWIGLLIVMYPLCRWYGALRQRTNNPIIKML